MGEGEKKFKEIGEKLKAEKETVEEQAVATKEAVQNQLQALKGNPALAQLYQENAQMGAQNLASELPLLKVHAVGKSQKNELADGSEPSDGYFFYKPTSEQFQTVTCHILTISKGFKAPGMEGKDIFNQILGGVMVDNGDYKPFIMYFTGLKLSYLWDFGKQAAKYTKARPVSIPMFALTVKLTTEKVSNNFGKSWIIKFEIVRNDDTSPVLVMDAGEFTFLKDSVETVEETIASLIEAKVIRENEPVNSIEGVVTDSVPLTGENILF